MPRFVKIIVVFCVIFTGEFSVDFLFGRSPRQPADLYLHAFAIVLIYLIFDFFTAKKADKQQSE